MFDSIQNHHFCDFGIHKSTIGQCNISFETSLLMLDQALCNISSMPDIDSWQSLILALDKKMQCCRHLGDEMATLNIKDCALPLQIRLSLRSFMSLLHLWLLMSLLADDVDDPALLV